LKTKTYTNIRRIVLGGSYIVDNLVTGKESQSIRISLEVLNLREDVGQVGVGVCCPGGGSVNGHEGRVDIDNDVDTSSIKDAHARVVVGLRVDIVDTNGVDLKCRISMEELPGTAVAKDAYAKLLQKNGIAQADISIAQHVLAGVRIEARLAAGLVVDADNLEPGLGRGINIGETGDIGGVDSEGAAD
jgi:hypothetical protein